MPVRPVTSSRRVVGVFLALVLVPSVLLVGLGWRLFQQDRTVSLQQLQERRRQTADLAVSILEQALASAEQSLRDVASLGRVAAHGDAAAIVVERGRMSVAAGGRVAYLPAPAPGQPVRAEPFLDADEWGRNGDVSRAGAKYRELAESRDPATRAGALLRLKKGVAIEEQLELLARMKSIEGAAIEDVPVELFARVERCRLLEDLGGPWSTGKRRRSATTSSAVAGQSAAASMTPIFTTRGAGHETDTTLRRATAAERLAAAVDAWWSSPADAGTRSGRRFTGDGLGATLLWSSEGERRILLAALPEYVEREWVATTASLASRQNARILTRDPATRGAQGDEERRSAADTGLPWSVVVADADLATDLAQVEGRRSLWLSGLAALVLLLGAGAYLVTRAVGRELAVARLQSDFVAAVSHEFRTPLTSMRQLTEILVDERVTDGQRRRSYYLALARQTDRLHRLVESLLDLGRLETGRSPYRLEPLDACALVRSVVDDFRARRRGHGVRIDLEIDGDAAPGGRRQGRADERALESARQRGEVLADCRTVWVSVEREARAPADPRSRSWHRHSARRAARDLRQVRARRPRQGRRLQGHGHRPVDGAAHRPRAWRGHCRAERARRRQHVHAGAAARN